MQIVSAQNPKIKDLLALQDKPRLRREKALFTVEGQRELSHCMEAGYEADTVFVCPEIAGDFRAPQGAKVFEVSRTVYEKIACRGGTEGVVAEVKARPHSLEDLPQRDNPLIVVLEGVEKPGNLGAVLRSADAAGADAVIICDPLTDIYNPNLIRASIGAVFTVPVAVCTSEEAIAYLKERGIKIHTAQLQDSREYYDTPMTGPVAIVMGTEATGLTSVWREAADSHIRIPMLGRLDSLNVSVSAAILLYEAVRQRKAGKNTVISSDGCRA